MSRIVKKECNPLFCFRILNKQYPNHSLVHFMPFPEDYQKSCLQFRNNQCFGIQGLEEKVLEIPEE